MMLDATIFFEYTIILLDDRRQKVKILRAKYKIQH